MQVQFIKKHLGFKAGDTTDVTEAKAKYLQNMKAVAGGEIRVKAVNKKKASKSKATKAKKK